MLGMLKDKTVFSKIILSSIPLIAFCNNALSSVVAGVILILTVALSWLCVSALKGFLNSKTAPFVRIIIAVGFVGVFSMVSALLFKEITNSIFIGLALIPVTTVALISADDILSAEPLSVLKSGGVIGGVAAGFVFAVGMLCEFLGMGSFFGINIYTALFSPMEFFQTPAGALLICAALVVIYNLIVRFLEKRAKV